METGSYDTENAIHCHRSEILFRTVTSWPDLCVTPFSHYLVFLTLFRQGVEKRGAILPVLTLDFYAFFNKQAKATKLGAFFHIFLGTIWRSKCLYIVWRYHGNHFLTGFFQNFWTGFVWRNHVAKQKKICFSYVVFVFSLNFIWTRFWKRTGFIADDSIET